MLPESSAEALKSYVRNGGHLVAEARLGWSNERGVASERIPGMGLWELMGCRELAVQTGARGRTELHWTDGAWPGMATGEKLAARWYEETLEPTSDAARVVARFADGGAAAVASSYGRGQTLMLGSYLSAAYESTPTREVERFYAGLLKWAGVVAPAIAGGVEVRTLESGTERVVVAFNHGKTAADAVIAVDGTKAIDLVTGAVVPVSGGELKKRMATGEVWAVRVSR
jgi:beta-galactosidase